jgi:hypothetical protein
MISPIRYRGKEGQAFPVEALRDESFTTRAEWPGRPSPAAKMMPIEKPQTRAG